MTFREWAKQELDRIPKDSEGLQDKINKDILAFIELFESQNHSGLTGNYVIGILTKLLNGVPLFPLTGEEDEWEDVSYLFNDRIVEQNKRYRKVYRENRDNSTAFIRDAKVFSVDGGKTWFTCNKSEKYITFPYEVPLTPEYIILK